MNSIKVYVLAHGISTLYRVLSSLGFGNDVIGVVLGTFYTLMGSVFGDTLAVALVLPLYLFDVVSNLNISLPQWVTDTYNFVFGTIAYYWNWLVNSVYDLNNAFRNLPTTIQTMLDAVYQGIQDKLNWLTWLRDNAGNILNNLIYQTAQFIWNNLPSWAKDALYKVSQKIDGLISFYNAVAGEIHKFLNNPLAYVLGAIFKDFTNIVQTVSNDWQYFSWLFNEGKKYLVDFFRDPAGFILEMIADVFLQWLADLLAEKW